MSCFCHYPYLPNQLIKLINPINLFNFELSAMSCELLSTRNPKSYIPLLKVIELFLEGGALLLKLVGNGFQVIKKAINIRLAQM